MKKGKKRDLVAEDFAATVFQHELDHLDGVLYVDRVQTQPGKTQLAFVDEYRKYLVPHPESEIRELAD